MSLCPGHPNNLKPSDLKSHHGKLQQALTSPVCKCQMRSEYTKHPGKDQNQQVRGRNRKHTQRKRASLECGSLLCRRGLLAHAPSETLQWKLKSRPPVGFCQIGFKISEGCFFSPRARLGLSESQSDNHGEDGRAFAGRRQRVYSV